MSAGHDTEKSLKKIEMNVVVSFNMNRIKDIFITDILKRLGMDKFKSFDIIHFYLNYKL